MKQFFVTNRRKTIKRLVPVSRKFTIKKIRIQFESCFFRNLFPFFYRIFSLETGYFSYRGFINDKCHLQSNDAQSEKNLISRNRSCFFCVDSEYFHFDFLWGFLWHRLAKRKCNIFPNVL